jgi:hypothetical protein
MIRLNYAGPRPRRRRWPRGRPAPTPAAARAAMNMGDGRPSDTAARLIPNPPQRGMIVFPAGLTADEGGGITPARDNRAEPGEWPTRRRHEHRELDLPPSPPRRATVRTMCMAAFGELAAGPSPAGGVSRAAGNS